MINVQMTSPDGVTLATSGKYCADNVRVTPTLQSKTVTPTTEQQIVEPDAGYAGLSEVTVEAAEVGGGYSAETMAALIDRTITEITIPDGMTVIGSNAFNGCVDLASIYIPDSVTSIDSSAFNRCQKLLLDALPPSLETVGDGAFIGCQKTTLSSLPDTLKNIGSNLFDMCIAIEDMTLPSGLPYTTGNMFRRCTGLDRVTFLGKPETVHATTFNGCTQVFTICVPWAEGEVAGAPWGATNATIIYNYTGEEA